MRLSRDEMLMDVADIVSQRGTCSRKKVGVVVSRDGRILVSGYNGAPSGMAHCDHFRDEADFTGCIIAVHAEANAIAFAARFGISVEGAELYTTCSPCLACAQLIINSGIIRVVYREMYRDVAGQELLEAAGIEVVGEGETEGIMES